MRDPLPVLYLDHTARLGGGEIALWHLLRGLDRTRLVPIVVLASDGPLVERLHAAGVEAHVLPLPCDIVNTRKDTLGPCVLLRGSQALACLRYALRLAVWAKRRGVQLIHTNSLKADIYGGLAGRLAGIPVVWHVRDGIHDAYLPRTVAALFRAFARRFPRAIVANSASTLRSLRLPKTARAWVVHDGCELPSETLTAPMEGPPIVALVGRITPWKGQHVFLRAAARVRENFPDARFWIIGAPLFGEDSYERSLHTLAGELGVTEHVTFWGFQENVAALLARVTVVAHASVIGEPFGQVVIEGMAAGKPVVATNGGALPEIVVPGETGWLVPMGDDAALAEAVMALLADPARAATMGAAGRRRIAECFTTAHTAQGVMHVYEQMAEPIDARSLCDSRKDSSR